MKKAKMRQRSLFMASNLLAFTLIFGVFGFIIYSQMYHSLFEPVHRDLEQARNAIEGYDPFVEEQISFRFDAPEEPPQGAGAGPGDLEGRLPNGSGKPPEGAGAKRFRLPMRVQAVVRDSGGNVMNSHVLGRIFWETILREIPFDADGLDSVTPLQLEDGTAFHSLSFAREDGEGTAYYIQLLTNVDGEQAIIDNVLRILVVFVVLFVLLSITASCLLSQISMAPLLKSWDRQIEFVGNASHELRTPLTIIQNKLESLLAAPQETILQRADDIAVSLSETRRLSKLTSDLMTLARADSNATQLQISQISLDELIREISEPYGELAAMEEKSLKLELAYGEILQGDRERIHELMVILLDNALKYTQEGDAIVIRTCLRDSRAVIEVADTGMGIREESMKRIFDRFYREEKARSRENGGSGLGLSIAKWIVEAHGGAIKAYPNQPRGTVVQVKL